ncbi:MAG TPA: SBBP repeat-containing protein [Gemmataceae bacterium]|nr:SBBP repeat-containing protein [Gemmataceae bacterium]
MHPFARRCSQPSRKRHPGSYRPRLDCLEDRLPPGDTLGWLLVGSTLGWPALAAVETVQAESGGEWAAAEKTELRMGNGPFEMDHSQLQFADPQPVVRIEPSGESGSPAGVDADTLDFHAFVLGGFERGSAGSGLPGTGDLLPPMPMAKASSSPNGVPASRVEPASPPATPTAQGNSVKVGTSAPAGAAVAPAPASVGSAPLRFEANQGQTDAAVRFLAHGPGYNLFLTSTEAVLVLGPTAVLRMQLVGSSRTPQAIGLDKLPGTVNYYLGNDPTNWHTDIPTFAQVAYHNIYPGIDLVYHSRDGQLEYDFAVSPGANPAAITLSFTGADRLAIDSQGDLVANVAGTEIREHTPRIYQDRNGTPQEIAGQYVLEDGQRVHFRVGAYDPSQRLVIDPVVRYSTYLGGSGLTGGASIAVDASRHVYVTGSTNAADFPTLNPSQPNSGGGLGNAYVTSLDSTGEPLFSTYLGGSGFDQGNGIAVDPAGHVTVTGETTSPDFPALDAFQPAFGGGGIDAFVTNLDKAGRLVYSTYLGGSGTDVGTAVAVDGFGHAFVAGTTSSQDFPTQNAFQPALAGRSNGFVTCLDASGLPVYSTYLGGSGKDLVHDLAVDLLGRAYVTGETSSADFPTVNAFQANLAGFENAFVTCLDGSGQPVYSTYLGGSVADYGFGIATDPSGNIDVSGSTYSADFPTLNAFQANLAGLENAFVASLDGSGRLRYSTFLGGSNADAAFAIAVDLSGRVYVTGPTNSSDFPMLDPFQAAYGGGLYDAFVASLDAAGQPLYSSYLGGSSLDYGNGIAVDSNGQAYVAGSTASVDFPTQNAFQASLGGIQSAFITIIA